jgi:hypothetical protein
MPKRTLHLDIQADDGFINSIEANVRLQWSKMPSIQRKITSALIKALNEDRQASTKELMDAFPSVPTAVTLEKAINELRGYNVPVIVSVGRGGGYRLPVSRAECDWYLQTEILAIFRKMERLVTTNTSMAHYGVAAASGLDSLATLLKVHKLKASEGTNPEVSKKSRGR